MGDNKFYLIGILVLAFSIICGSYLLSNAVKDFAKNMSTKQVTYELTGNKDLMNETEAAQYLHLSPEEFKKLLEYEKKRRQQVASYDTFSFLPYYKINGVSYFSKTMLDKWIEYHSLTHSEIITNLD